MKKLLSLVLVFAFILLSVPAFADVTGYNNGTALGRGEEVNFANGLTASKSGEKFTVSLFGVAGGGTSIATGSSQALPLTYSVVTIGTNSAVGNVCTLANGTAGQIITFIAANRAGSDTVVITPATATGFTTATLGANGSYATLQYINSTIGWIVLAYSATGAS